MPVWHARTKELRAQNSIQVIGLVQEQHADRAQLYAAWQEFDFPILWDPFNTTESMVVPRAILIDSGGIVRKIGARPRDLEAFLLASGYERHALPALREALPTSLPVLKGVDLGPQEERARVAMGRLLWPEAKDRGIADDPAQALIDLAQANPSDGRAQFRAGVALRMRFDGANTHKQQSLGTGSLGTGSVAPAVDFQSALDHWSAALALQPNQYIWRRRIQQYGPRLDKPYPFYTWVQEARDAMIARGIDPVPLVAELTPAELMSPRRIPATSSDTTGPDPKGEIIRAEGLVQAQQAIAFHTDAAKSVAMVHLSLHPNETRQVHWNNEVDPTRVWLDHDSLPAGVLVDTRLLTSPSPGQATSEEARRFSFEVTLPEGVESTTIKGYALFHVCEGEEGVCVFRRLDLSIPVRRG
ncbi:MAG: hypothetical protein ACI8QS_000858 [Planctomycetota bacterium]